MLRVELAQARPGMELAMPISHPRMPGRVLLRAGFVLDSKTIGRLADLHARDVWIRYPGLDFVAEQISPEIVQAGQELTGAIGEAFGEVLSSGSAQLDYGLYRRAVGDLMSRLVDNPKAATLVVELAGSQVPMSRSAGQGAFLALILGLKLETYLILSRTRLGMVARDVSNLGIGALLRDIGMLELAPGDRWRWRAACDETDPTWREHVKIGYERVRGEIEPSAAAAVLHHHQRFDGSGFPMRITVSGEEEPLAGRDIHIFSRIIAAADLFDRMRYPASSSPDRADPEPVPVVRVLRRLLRGPASSWLDPIVAKALVQAVPPFPVGSMVRLSDGRFGAVVAWDALQPCRPVVAILPGRSFDPTNLEEPRERVDLREYRGLSIAEAEGQDVRGDVFEAESGDEFDVYKAQSALICMPVGKAG
ncbi:MAG: HD domain-containing protein [Phycisphaerales bacterium]|nr:HD domain-containing protein [Phycisphaerales bacterium]